MPDGCAVAFAKVTFWPASAKSGQSWQDVIARADEITPIRLNSGEVVDLVDVSRQLLSWHNVNPLMS